MKMSQNNSIHVIEFVELCLYIMPNVSNNVQTQEICTFIHGNGALHLANVNRTWIHHPVHEHFSLTLNYTPPRPMELIAAILDNVCSSTGCILRLFALRRVRTDTFYWSCVSLHWADQARQEVRHRNSVENPLNLQNKTPYAIHPTIKTDKERHNLTTKPMYPW